MRAKRRATTKIVALLAALALLAAGCAPDDDDVDPDDPDAIATDFGVDADEQVLRIGALNDESGPSGDIGVPFAVGKRILVEQINAGEIDILPEGWTVELVERDHSYDPANAQQAYTEIADDVLFIATSFGTPPTLPLIEDAQMDQMVLYPASLSSELAVNEVTPPVGAPYRVEAHQAVEYILDEHGEDAQIGVVWAADDYGQDGIEGAQEAAEHYGIELAADIEVPTGDTEMGGTVSELQGAGVEHVITPLLPPQQASLIGTAAAAGYDVEGFYGLTASWVDLFFGEEDLMTVAELDFHWVTGLYSWGEAEEPGQSLFFDGYEQYAADDHDPDFYIQTSYAQGVVALEVFARALENGDVTREGYLETLQATDDVDAFGLLPEPADFTTFPYEVTTDTRVLRPGSTNEDWWVLRDWSVPESYEGVGL